MGISFIEHSRIIKIILRIKLLESEWRRLQHWTGSDCGLNYLNALPKRLLFLFLSVKAIWIKALSFFDLIVFPTFLLVSKNIAGDVVPLPDITVNGIQAALDLFIFAKLGRILSHFSKIWGKHLILPKNRLNLTELTAHMKTQWLI